MNQRGIIFIAPIVFLLIGAVIGASLTLGIVQYKDEIAASVSNIFKKTEIIVSNEEVELPEEPEEPTVPEPAPTPEPKPAPKPAPKPQPQPQPAPAPEPEPAASEGGPLRQSDSEASEPRPEESGREPVFEPTPGLDPDLIIQSVTYAKAPVEGDMMSFYAAIKNQGEGSANVSNANLSIDETDIQKITTPILISNQAETLIWTEAWKATKGEYKLKICLDADAKISESNEENNCFESIFYVSKTQLLAEYIVKSHVMTPSSPAAGDTLSFSAEVYNRGNAFAAGISSTQLRIDLNNDGTWDIPTKNASTEPLDPNTDERENWMNVWAIPSGTHKYEICADALRNITESNDENNCVSKTFTVP